jgi:hypothetical protein
MSKFEANDELHESQGLEFYVYLKVLFRHTLGINSSEALRRKCPVSGRM